MDHDGAIVAVLAGGRGTRLGTAKATARLAGRPLIARPLGAARRARLQALVVAKADTALPALAERVLVEPDHPRHPLCGLVAALSFAQQLPSPPAVVALACDMPFVTAPVLTWLAALPGTAIVAVDGRPEPLLARYRVCDLPALQSALGERLSLREAAARLPARIVDGRELAPFGDPARLCFNVNTPDDLRTAARWAREADRAR